jgi:hypothetical protein
VLSLRVRDIALQLRERFGGGASISAAECGVLGPAVGLLELPVGFDEGSGCMSFRGLGPATGTGAELAVIVLERCEVSADHSALLAG